MSLGLSFLSQIARRDRSVRHGVVIAAHFPKCARFGEGRKMVVVIAECLAQNVIGMFAEQRCSYGLDHRGQAHIERSFDIGDRTCSRVRDTAQAAALARFGRIEPLLDRAKITNRYVGLDRKSTRLNSSHVSISYAVFCL